MNHFINFKNFNPDYLENIIDQALEMKRYPSQYAKVMERVRPGHADYTFFIKYGRFRDWRGAGRSSGRETACRVAAGAIAKKILAREGIEVRGYTKEMAGIPVRPNLTWNDIVANTETLSRPPTR